MTIRNIGNFNLQMLCRPRPFIPLSSPPRPRSRFSIITKIYDDMKKEAAESINTVLSVPYRYRKAQHESIYILSRFSRIPFNSTVTPPYPANFGLFFFYMQAYRKGVKLKYE